MTKSILVLVFITFFLNNCGEPEIKYVKTPCPKLTTWKVEPLTGVQYEIRTKQ